MARRPVILLDVMDTLVVDPYYHAMPAFFGLSRKELKGHTSDIVDRIRGRPHQWG